MKSEKTDKFSFRVWLRFFSLIVFWVGMGASPLAAQDKAAGPDFPKVEAIFAEHCLDCHTAQEPEGKLILETHELLMKGGESGAVVLPGKSSESLLVEMIEGRLEREGKKKIMPPGKRKKLTAEEIAVIRQWIDAGAAGPPDGRGITRELNVPKIAPSVPPRRSIQSLAYEPSSKVMAVGRYGEVELISTVSRAVIIRLGDARGMVNALAFSPDGQMLFAAAGEPGLFGEVRQWKVPEGKLVKTYEGHRDALYSLALTPDGKLLATGSYDQKIKLWNTETGAETKTLTGHNGAVFGLSFRKDGKILASASADRTVKLWDVATGERRDTLAQSLKELYAVAFTADGQRLLAGGVDNRIRMWKISESAAETTNPLLEARFAHEGAILRLVVSTDGKHLLSSADDRTVKLWDLGELKEQRVLEVQPDWAPGLAFIAENQGIAVGRLDGTWQLYEAKTGSVMPLPKPVLTRAEPRGVQRGTTNEIRLQGMNLFSISEIKVHDSRLRAELIDKTGANGQEVWIRLGTPGDLPRGGYEMSAVGAGGETGRLTLHVDDLPQVVSQKGDHATSDLAGPVSVWGTHEKIGEMENYTVQAEPGQTLVFDVAAKRIGSKADVLLTLLDGEGKILASNSGFDGSNDPFLTYEATKVERLTVRVSELLLGASADHFYRLSIGTFPFVTGCFPLSVPANAESEVELVGYNLPADRKVRVKAGKAGEMDLPLDGEKYRTRRVLKLVAGDGLEVVEREPNDEPAQAMPIQIPVSVGGRIWRTGTGRLNDLDVDLYRFKASPGQVWIIETAAASRGTPLDTKLEILHADGRPVPRTLLQAVRDSAVTFRGIDSNGADCRVENWEEMELNQFLYLQGEVVKLFRAPQGPDSGFVFYMSNGKRRTYFDTSATAHANEEKCYIVEPHPPGAKLVANGLPVFPLFYSNDDDGERKLGPDSKVHFSAPSEGEYLIRLTDTRGHQGERFGYRLLVRPARPDFNVTLNAKNPTVHAGSGQGFSVTVERIDGFENEVRVDITNVPAGWVISSPLVIQAGHSEARGTIFALPGAVELSEAASTNIVVRGSAMVNGGEVQKTVSNFGRIKLGEAPRLFVALEPAGVAQAVATAAGQPANANGEAPLEITVAPGQTVPALLKIKRNGHDELVTFTVENLPHGVIVDNIGLNGVLIPKDQTEREIFINAARWVPETDRLCYAVENQAGRQTSRPVMLRVRREGLSASARAAGLATEPPNAAPAR